jgi:WD40 repeat protein
VGVQVVRDLLHSRSGSGSGCITDQSYFWVANRVYQSWLPRFSMDMAFSRNLDAARNSDALSSSWLSGRWIRPQPIHHNPYDKLMYIGTGKISHRAMGRSYLLDQVEVINSETMEHARSIVAPRPFFSLALSKDGKIIYTVSPDDRTVTMLDSSTSAEVKVIRNVGVSPIRVIVSQ